MLFKNKYKSQIEDLEEEIVNKDLEIGSLEKRLRAVNNENEALNDRIYDLEHKLERLAREAKFRQKLINQFEISFAKSVTTIESLNNQLLKKELLRRKAAGRIGGLTAAYNKLKNKRGD